MEKVFALTHEWFCAEDGTIGISDYAQKELGDIVFVELPEVGDKVTKGKPFANVESVKAVSEIFSPVNGVVTEINEKLLDSPETINENADSAWFIKIENAGGYEDLLPKTEYEKTIG